MARSDRCLLTNLAMISALTKIFFVEPYNIIILLEHKNKELKVIVKL